MYDIFVLSDGESKGAYDVNADALIEELSENSASSNASRRRRREVTSLDFKGVSDPTTCLLHGSIMMWKVSNTDYPQYDAGNLFNTNPSFDDGPFKELAEKHEQESTRFTLFAYRFDQEGVYTFKSSANPDSVMVSSIYAFFALLYCLFYIFSSGYLRLPRLFE